MALDERRYSFVVKIWEERRDIPGAEPTWRGSVDDVQRGDRLYFNTLIELSDYLKNRSGMRKPHHRIVRLLTQMRS
jgi:hypothetical protein